MAPLLALLVLLASAGFIKSETVPGLIITGGYRDGGRLSSVETWPAAPCPLYSQFLALPEARYAHTLSMLGTTIVACGGRYTERSCIQRSPGQWSQWRPLSPYLGEKRACHSAVSTGDKVLLLGGETEGSKRTGEVVPGGATFPLLHDRESSCSILVPGGRFVVTGGGYPTAHGHVDSYSVSGEHLSPLPSLRTPRSGHGCAAFQDSAGRTALLVLGGWDGSSPLSSVEFLPGLDSNAWQAAAPLPRPLSFLRAATLPGGPVLATGGRDSSWTARAEVLQYSEGSGPGEGDSWAEVGRMGWARRSHAILAIEDLNTLCG